MAKGVFIAEKMKSTKDITLLSSAVSDSEIENGAIVVLGDLVTGETDLYEAGAVAAVGNEIWFVDGVELTYSEETTKGLDDFVNPAGKPFRVRKPQVGDTFSISASMITPLDSGTGLVKGNLVETPATGNKIKEKATSLTSGVSFGGKIVDLWNFGSRAIPMARIKVTEIA
jgi:hypothetical protein